MILPLFVSVTIALADRPSNQTTKQKEILSHWDNYAPTFSEDAKQQLLDYFSGHQFKTEIANTSLVYMTSMQLLDWVVRNVRNSAYIHTFGYSFLKYLQQNEYAPNIWEMLLAQRAPYSKVQDTAEQTFMHYPPFTVKEKPNITEAMDRPQYLSVNLWQAANGQPFYGEMNLVLHPSHKKYCILAPVDTGGYAQECHLVSGNAPHGNCTIWSKDKYPFGTYDHFLHLILRHHDYYQYPLSDLMKKWLGYEYTDEWYYHHYYEADLMGTFLLPEHLHYVIANFSLWGQADVQEFATVFSKPLMWSGELNLMVVDLMVGHVGGQTISGDDKANFTKAWAMNRTLSWNGLLKHVSPLLTLRYQAEGICWREYKYSYTNAVVGKLEAMTADLCCYACDENPSCFAWTFYDFGPFRSNCTLHGLSHGREKGEGATSGRRSSCPPIAGRAYIGVNRNGTCLYDM